MSAWTDAMDQKFFARGEPIQTQPFSVGPQPYQIQQFEQTGEQNPTNMLLSSLLSGMSGQGANPQGYPAASNSNRFETGLSDAESRLRSLLDNPDSINKSAAYKFRVGQGQEALQRSMGAKGLLNSGNRLTELTKYGQDMGSQEYEAQAGRLGSLLGNYSQSWLGDKNANTARFGAEAGAWNTAQGNADANRYRMASLAWDMSKPQVGSRTSSGMTIPNGTVLGMGGATDWTMHNNLIASANANQDKLSRY